jgi:hypothetical protein
MLLKNVVPGMNVQGHWIRFCGKFSKVTWTHGKPPIVLPATRAVLLVLYASEQHPTADAYRCTIEYYEEAGTDVQQIQIRNCGYTLSMDLNDRVVVNISGITGDTRAYPLENYAMIPKTNTTEGFTDGRIHVINSPYWLDLGDIIEITTNKEFPRGSIELEDYTVAPDSGGSLEELTHVLPTGDFVPSDSFGFNYTTDLNNKVIVFDKNLNLEKQWSGSLISGNPFIGGPGWNLIVRKREYSDGYIEPPYMAVAFDDKDKPDHVIWKDGGYVNTLIPCGQLGMNMITYSSNEFKQGSVNNEWLGQCTGAVFGRIVQGVAVVDQERLPTAYEAICEICRRIGMFVPINITEIMTATIPWQDKKEIACLTALLEQSARSLALQYTWPQQTVMVDFYPDFSDRNGWNLAERAWDLTCKVGGFQGIVGNVIWETYNPRRTYELLPYQEYVKLKEKQKYIEESGYEVNGYMLDGPYLRFFKEPPVAACTFRAYTKYPFKSATTEYFSNIIEDDNTTMCIDFEACVLATIMAYKMLRGASADLEKNLYEIRVAKLAKYGGVSSIIRSEEHWSDIRINSSGVSE